MKISIKFGIISGIIISAWIIGGNYFELYQTGFAKMLYLFPFVFQMAFLLWGIKETKVKKYSGNMSYASALLSGFVITIVLALIYSGANYLYFKCSDNHMVNFFLIENKKYLTEIKKPELIEESSKMIVETLKPGSQAVSAFRERLIPGIVFTFIFAMILRKRKEPVFLEKSK